MPENISSQKNNIIIAVVVVVAILGGGYYFYSSSQGDGAVSSAQMDPSLLTNPGLKAFYVAQKDINLKDTDLAFTKTPFYENLQDHTVEIPSVEPTGRPNPFWAP